MIAPPLEISIHHRFRAGQKHRAGERTISLMMSAEVRKALPVPELRRIRGGVRSREAIAKHLPLAVLALLLVLPVGVRLVASQPGTAEARPAPSPVEEAHIAYYEEHLARLALDGAICR